MEKTKLKLFTKNSMKYNNEDLFNEEIFLNKYNFSINSATEELID